MVFGLDSQLYIHLVITVFMYKMLYHLVSNFNFQRILFVVVEEDLDGYFKVLLAFCLVSVDDFIVLCGWLDVHL